MSDEYDNHPKIIISSGERTRGILYLLGLMFAALLAVFSESDLFNWADIRHEKISKAYLCYTEGLGNDSPVPVIEPNDSDKCGKYYDYVERYYYIALTPPPFSSEHNYHKTWNAMSDRYQLLTKEFVEGASITIPIIAIKIDRGNAFLYAIIMTTIVLMTLRLSMQNEIKCIYDMVPMITNRQRSDAVVNCHVFAKSRANSFSFWWFLFAPSAIIVLDVLHNSLQFGTAANVFNSGMLGVFYMVQAVATIVLVWVNILCFKSARDLDRQLSKIDEMLENAKDDLGRA